MEKMKISLLLASRYKDNSNFRLNECILSLLKNMTSPDNFEILIKLDDDEESVAHPLMSTSKEYLEWLLPLPAYPDIKIIRTPRASGYADLHKAYLDLLCLASPQSELFCVISDDLEIRMKFWDELLLEMASKNKGKPYIINTETDVNMLKVSQKEAINGADSYPVWSRAWLGIMGGFGYTWATDGWTSLVCHELENNFMVKKEEYRFFVNILPYRAPGEEVDLTEERWKLRARQRDDMFATLQSENVQSLLNIRAESLKPFIGKTV